MPVGSLARLLPVVLAGLCLTASSSTAAQTPSPTPQSDGKCVTDGAVAQAKAYVLSRPGSVSFAIYERGTVRSSGGAVAYRSASLVKAMLLSADLRRRARIGTPLTQADRKRLATMIRVSGNRAATATFSLVGRDELLAVARLVGMRGYRVQTWWSSSEVTASDQARFFGRLNSTFPKPYRAFARQLLGSIVRKQTWGGARIARRAGYETLFKAGWLKRPDGWIVHQGLRLERGDCAFGVAVLTGRQPDMSAGVESIRGIVQRLLTGGA